MSSKAFNISLPEELVQKIDKAAKYNYMTRSDYIRQSVVKSLRTEGKDPFGDEGRWETVVDFTDLPQGGLPAEKFLAILEELNGQDSQKPHKNSA